jgi:ATP-dependent helicase HrpA
MTFTTKERALEVYPSDAADAAPANAPSADAMLCAIDTCMVRDRHLLRRWLSGRDVDAQLTRAQGRFATSSARYAARRASVPALRFDDQLPISAHRAEIAELIRDHQVVVVCGETGSGKTTQLPKILLELGRGVGGLIGHTQPRRIAARTVANRIAEELGGALGQQVGFQVRFGAQVSEHNLVKVMTDGILLSEFANDRFLSRYDTIIIDEAHERSLNIDFILGYLRTLLPKRPDLKVVITSATIDPGRFSKHFGDAPVIEVSGRSYPVEVRYRPTTDIDGLDLNRAIGDAVREAMAHGPGDVLVFLPGEREIRDAAQYLRRAGLHDLDVQPFYARMGLAQQATIFRTSARRRVVLATNVAETSVTVPGICFVVDTGLARVSRYNYRTKVQGLPVENVSQAAAEQRKGRCGRIAPGVCFRLYAEDDFAQRVAFTDAEIVRTNLGAVILQMKSLRLGEIEKFPFIDAPDNRFVKDGYRLLRELGALDEQDNLTELGRKLARLPLDPQLSRMILEAGPQNAVGEVLTLAAALTIADPRERPLDNREAADHAHKSFADKQSDFVTWLNLWNRFAEQKRQRTRSELRAWCRDNFLNQARLREWGDVRRQLKSLAAELGLQVLEQPASYEQVHRALLSGLLSHVGHRQDEEGFRGARGVRFHLFPGSAIKAPGPRWVLAATLIQTRRLYAHGVARVEPAWIEQAAGALVSRRYHDPRWDPKRAAVVATEQVTLFGLVLVAGRKVAYARVMPVEARAIFIREALVRGRLLRRPGFVAGNRKRLAEVRLVERKLRRTDLAQDEVWQSAFYEQRLPHQVVDLKSLRHWLKNASAKVRDTLLMAPEALLRVSDVEAAGEAYPSQLAFGRHLLPVRYGFEPGADADGLTVSVPVLLLNQLDECRGQWLVPGLLGEKILALLRGLPKRLRRALVPLPDFSRACVEALEFDQRQLDQQPLTDSLGAALARMTGLQVPVDAWRPDLLSPHLHMRYEVLDDDGSVLATGRVLAELKRELGADSSSEFGELVASGEAEQRRDWDFGELPAQADYELGGIKVSGYPAVVDEIEAVTVRVLQDPADAKEAHHRGVRRLVMFDGGRALRSMPRKLANLSNRALVYATCHSADAAMCGLGPDERGPKTELEQDLLACALDAALGECSAVRDRTAFKEACRQASLGAGKQLEAVYQSVAEALDQYLIYQRLRAKVDGPGRVDALRDTDAQLGRLLHRRFVGCNTAAELKEFPRYVRGAIVRLEGLDRDARRDTARLAEVLSVEQPVLRKLAAVAPTWRRHAELVELRWLLEELRLSIFSQSIRSRGPISIKRIERRLAEF